MTKLPFEYVSKEVDKLYDKPIDKGDVDGLDKHIKFIVDFLYSCGYSEEDYTRAMFGFADLSTLN